MQKKGRGRPRRRRLDGVKEMYNGDDKFRAAAQIEMVGKEQVFGVI